MQISGRLVRQNQFWVGDDRASDADQLLLSAGKLPRIQILFRYDLKTVERVRYSRLALVLADLSIGERNLEIFINRQIVEQMILLENETDLFVAQRGSFFGFQMMNGRFIQKIFAAPSVVVHAENVEQRRFASAGWAHDRNEFAFGYVDVDVAQHVEKFSVSEGVTAFEIFKANHGGYSVRNAWIGLTWVARRAGSQVAMTAATASINGATVKAIGSSALTS